MGPDDVWLGVPAYEVVSVAQADHSKKNPPARAGGFLPGSGRLELVVQTHAEQVALEAETVGFGDCCGFAK
jgi:hypothetical protein